ncbi:MAG: hypothetical protein ABJN62_09755 [Halioglobus sp.]
MSEELWSWIDYKIHSPRYDDPCKHMTRIDAEVTASLSDEDGDEDIVARAGFYFVDLDNAFDDGDSPHFILDMESSTAPFMALYQHDSENGSWSFSDKMDLDDAVIFNFNLLIFDRIEVLPDFRGRGITRMVWEDALRLFGQGASIAALKTFPLQFEAGIKRGELSEWDKKLGLDKLGGNEEKAFNSLALHYAQLGFNLFGEGNLMYRPILEY